MSLTKYSELNIFKTAQAIDDEICRLRKVLVGLRIKTYLIENNKVHLIAHTKRTIAQLSLKKNSFSKSTIKISK